MQVSLLQLMGILEAHRGALILSARMRTRPDLLKKSRADGTPTEMRYPEGVERIAYGRFMVATNYEANVQAQRERENHPSPDQFEAGPMWPIKCPVCKGENPNCDCCHGEGKVGMGRQLGRFLVVHVRKPGMFYLRCRPQADDHGKPVKIRDEWLRTDNGDHLSDEELDDLRTNFLKASGNNRKQELDREIPYRAYDVETIESVTVGGVTYEIDHNGPKPEWLVPGPPLHPAIN
jgi:hypothetical protein